MDVHPDKIVFYDGDCGFCARVVQFILRHEKNNEIYFAALQSECADKLFKKLGDDEPDLETFYFYENGKLFDRSSAAFQLTKYLKFPYSMLGLARIFPRKLSDSVYNFIARRRRRILPESCYLPSRETADRFLN